jgi:hypothetical protein
MVVRVGAASARFLIVDRIDTNPLFNTYEAYAVNGRFVSSTPLVLMAFLDDNGDALRHFCKESYRLQMKEKNVVVDRAHYIIVYGGTYVFQGKQANYTSKSMLRNDKGYLDISDRENAALENLVADMIHVIMLGNHSRKRILDDEAKSNLFNIFVEKLEKKKYEECREMIKMLDADTVEKWSELFYRNQQIFWQ